jgi:hypothetical protein
MNAAAAPAGENMTAQEAQVSYCLGVRGIGIRLGSAPLDMAELLASLRDTHTLVNTEEIAFFKYRRLLTFKDNNHLHHRYFLVKEGKK